MEHKEYISSNSSVTSISSSSLDSLSSYDTSSVISNTIPDDVLFEIEEDIMTEIDDYVKYNILSYSSPDFHDKLIDNVTETIYDAVVNSGLCENTDSNRLQITNTIKEMSNRFFYELQLLTPRSFYANTEIENVFKFQSNTNDIINSIDSIKQIEQSSQRSQEWYENRYDLITASNIYKALGTDAQQNSLIYEKCRPLTTSNKENTIIGGARGWGQKYEPITAMIYEAMYPGNELDTSYGCIRHSQYKFLGASPDGIVVSGPRMGHLVEIKNTVSREITDTPIESHWVQCQIQMEVCNLPFCDYIQTNIKEITWEEFYQEQCADYKGVFLLLQQNEDGYKPINSLEPTQSPQPTYKYVYMPLNLLDCEPELYESVIDSWKYSVMMEFSDYYFVNLIYWKMEKASCVIIPRNREWFMAALPKFQEVWNKIEDGRINGYEKYAPKQKTKAPCNELIRSFKVCLEGKDEDIVTEFSNEL